MGKGFSPEDYAAREKEAGEAVDEVFRELTDPKICEAVQYLRGEPAPEPEPQLRYTASGMYERLEQLFASREPPSAIPEVPARFVLEGGEGEELFVMRQKRRADAESGRPEEFVVRVRKEERGMSRSAPKRKEFVFRFRPDHVVLPRISQGLREWLMPTASLTTNPF